MSKNKELVTCENCFERVVKNTAFTINKKMICTPCVGQVTEDKEVLKSINNFLGELIQEIQNGSTPLAQSTPETKSKPDKIYIGFMIAVFVVYTLTMIISLFIN